MDAERVGFLLCDDLICSSRLEGAAKLAGLRLSTCRKVAELLGQASRQRPVCVLIDLHFPGLVIADVAQELKLAGKPFIVGFGSHVQAEVLHNARTAGCDLVQPRSQFFEELTENLPRWFEA